MTEQKKRGRAVLEKPIIRSMTLSDGTERYVASRPVGDPELILNWLIKEAGKNPKLWFSLKDLYRFIFGGEPMTRNTEVWEEAEATLRGYITRTRKYAIEHFEYVSVKFKGRAVVKFKLLDRTSPAEMRAALNGGSKDLGLKYAWDKRVELECQTLGTNEVQLASILANRKARTAGPPKPDDQLRNE